MKPPERIETERLVLRKPRMEDAPAIFAGWAQDPEVTRYLTWRPHQRIEQTQEFVQSCLAAWENETRFPYMITLKESDEVIGMIDPRIEGPKVGIGYVIARSHWGKGYVPEATRAIIALGISATIDLSGLCHNRCGKRRFTACPGESRACNVKGFCENILFIPISAIYRVIVISTQSQSKQRRSHVEQENHLYRSRCDGRSHDRRLAAQETGKA